MPDNRFPHVLKPGWMFGFMRAEAASFFNQTSY